MRHQTAPRRSASMRITIALSSTLFLLAAGCSGGRDGSTAPQASAAAAPAAARPASSPAATAPSADRAKPQADQQPQAGKQPQAASASAPATTGTPAAAPATDRKQEIRQVERQLGAVRDRIGKSDALAGQTAAVAAARAEYEQARKDDTALQTARKAADDQKEKAREVLETRLAADSAAAPLLARRQALDTERDAKGTTKERKAALKTERNAIEQELRPIRDRIRKEDAAVKAANAEADAAAQRHRAAEEAGPLAAAKAKLDAARKAHQEAMKAALAADPEAKALQARLETLRQK